MSITYTEALEQARDKAHKRAQSDHAESAKRSLDVSPDMIRERADATAKVLAAQIRPLPPQTYATFTPLREAFLQQYGQSRRFLRQQLTLGFGAARA